MMSSRYQDVVLTLIAVLLGAIVAKLYLPAAQEIGIRLSPPTLGDLSAARQQGSPRSFQEIRSQVPVVWLNGGNADVEVTNTVDVRGELVAERDRSAEQAQIERYFSSKPVAPER
jgi:hypothetical protein